MWGIAENNFFSANWQAFKMLDFFFGFKDRSDSRDFVLKTFLSPLKDEGYIGLVYSLIFLFLCDAEWFAFSIILIAHFLD